MTPKQILDLLTTPEGREELRILAAEADGWKRKPRKKTLNGGTLFAKGKKLAAVKVCPIDVINDISHLIDCRASSDDLTEAERRLGLHDRTNVSLRVRYTQYLHELVALQPDTPVNNAGTPVVSDLDKYFAPTELKCCAYVLTAQWKAKQEQKS